MEWCNSGFSSAASCRYWRENWFSFFPGGILISLLTLKMGDRALRPLWGGQWAMRLRFGLLCSVAMRNPCRPYVCVGDTAATVSWVNICSLSKIRTKIQIRTSLLISKKLAHIECVRTKLFVSKNFVYILATLLATSTSYSTLIHWYNSLLMNRIQLVKNNDSLPGQK